MAFTRSPVLWDKGKKQHPDRPTEGSGSLWHSELRTDTLCNHLLGREIERIRHYQITHIHSLKHKHALGSTCEGVHKGGERAIEHLKEGVSTGEALRATQNRVLQNVRNTGAVHRCGTKLHTTITHMQRNIIWAFTGVQMKILRCFKAYQSPSDADRLYLKRLLESSRAAWRYWAPVASWESLTAVRNKSGTAVT